MNIRLTTRDTIIKGAPTIRAYFRLLDEVQMTLYSSNVSTDVIWRLWQLLAHLLCIHICSALRRTRLTGAQ